MNAHTTKPRFLTGSVVPFLLFATSPTVHADLIALYRFDDTTGSTATYQWSADLAT